MKIKTILSSLFTIVLATGVFAQSELPVNEDNGQAEYTEVIEVSGASADELYQRAENWIKDFYPNPSGVMKAKVKGEKIEGTARFRLNSKDRKGNIIPNGGFVSYQLELMFKEGRYKYRVHRIRWEQASYFDVAKWLDTSDPDYNAEVYNYNIEQTTVYMGHLIESLIKSLSEAKEVQSDDW